jgi:acetyltransferase-like isoleucine patch superfamily enzyme
MLKRLLNRFPSSKATPPPPLTKDRLPQYEIGRWTYGVPEVFAWGEGATLRIGAFCSIAAGVKIYLGGEHRVDWVTTFPFPRFWPEASHIQGHPRTKGDVVIGSDVWIAADATLLSGVTVGHGAVIGLGAVVSRDIPPYTIVAGNPATRLRSRFDDLTVQRLLRLAWWDWDEARIRRHLPLMLSARIEEFLSAAEADAEASSGGGTPPISGGEGRG